MNFSRLNHWGIEDFSVSSDWYAASELSVSSQAHIHSRLLGLWLTDWRAFLQLLLREWVLAVIKETWSQIRMKDYLPPWAAISASSLQLLVCHYYCYCSRGDGAFGTVSWHSPLSSQYFSFLFLSLSASCPVGPKLWCPKSSMWRRKRGIIIPTPLPVTTASYLQAHSAIVIS